MKKTAKPRASKKIITKPKKKITKSKVANFEWHKLPIIVYLLTVILMAIYIISSLYLPKKQAETYYLSGNNTIDSTSSR